MRKVKLKEVQDVLKKEHSNVTLLNVLPPASFEEGHIPDSLNIPSDSPDLVEQLKEHVVNQDTPIVVYCSGPECPISHETAVLLEEAGFTNVMHFEGGMEEWKHSGKEVATGV